MKAKRIVTAGGTGFVGSHLIENLRRNGCHIMNISRRAGITSLHKFTWDQIKEPNFVLPTTDVVVNISGESIFSKPFWTKSYQKRIKSSRIDTNKALVKAITNPQLTDPPKVFITASAVGYYPLGIPGPTVDEDWKEPAPGFMGSLVKEWEESAEIPADSPHHSDVRVVKLRFGLILGKDGGIFPQQKLLFQSFLGGPIGTGEQGFPWVHIDDVVGIIEHAIENENMKGVYNVVGPEYATQKQYCKELGNALHRPSWLSVPGFALTFLGSERKKILLCGHKVIPKRTLESGYNFKYPTLHSAIASLV